MRIEAKEASLALGDAPVAVRVRAGDNLMLHRAIDLAQPGDVVVCDGGGDLSIAVAGDLMIGHAARRGIAALRIVDERGRALAGRHAHGSASSSVSGARVAGLLAEAEAEAEPRAYAAAAA